jgi:hypothetical protein
VVCDVHSSEVGVQLLSRLNGVDGAAAIPPSLLQALGEALHEREQMTEVAEAVFRGLMATVRAVAFACQAIV